MPSKCDVDRRHHEEMKASRAMPIEAREIPREVYREWVTMDQRAENQQAISPVPQVKRSKKPGNFADFERTKSLKVTPTEKEWREEANVSSVQSPAKARFKRGDLTYPSLDHGIPIEPLPRVVVDAPKKGRLQQESIPKRTKATLQQRLLDKSDCGLRIQNVPRHTVKICPPPRTRQRSMSAIQETVDSPASLGKDSDDDHRSVLTNFGGMIRIFDDTTAKRVPPSLDIASAVDPCRSSSTDSVFDLGSDSNSEDALRKRDLRKRAFGQSGNLSAIEERILRYPSPIPSSMVHPAMRETKDPGPHKSIAMEERIEHCPSMVRLVLRDDSCSNIKGSIAKVVHSSTPIELAPPPRSRYKTAPKEESETDKK